MAQGRLMARVMVLWCPDWPVVSHLGADAPADAPVAVIDGQTVVACSAAARQEGVRRGMRRRDAQARCPDVVLRAHDPAADARAFEPVLELIEALSAQVAPLRPGLCGLAVPARYYGGEVEAAAVLAEQLVEHGVWDVRCGVADDLFAAEQAARQAAPQDSVIVPAGGSARFVRDLPVTVLGDPEMADLLRRLGIRSLGDFAELRLADVRTRFGPAGVLAYRWARGEDPRLLSRREIPPDLVARVPFEPPLDRVEAIAFSVRRTAESFVSLLADRGAVATAVRIEIDSDGVLSHARTWRHPRWFSSSDIVDRVRWQAQVPGAVVGPVDEVRLVPEAIETIGEHAESLFGDGADEGVERVVARVQSLVGPEAVRSAAVQGGTSPGERQLTSSWGDRPAEVRELARPWPGSIPEPAPARVFAEPMPVQVLGAGGRPVVITERGGLTGEPARFRLHADEPWQQVAGWAGPWPLDEMWWDEHAARRIARFQVVGVDGSAWLMCVEDGQWWTEARYD